MKAQLRAVPLAISLVCFTGPAQALYRTPENQDAIYVNIESNIGDQLTTAAGQIATVLPGATTIHSILINQPGGDIWASAIGSGPGIFMQASHGVLGGRFVLDVYDNESQWLARQAYYVNGNSTIAASDLGAGRDTESGLWFIAIKGSSISNYAALSSHSIVLNGACYGDPGLFDVEASSSYAIGYTDVIPASNISMTAIGLAEHLTGVYGRYARHTGEFEAWASFSVPYSDFDGNRGIVLFPVVPEAMTVPLILCGWYEFTASFDTYVSIDETRFSTVEDITVGSNEDPVWIYDDDPAAV
jgi:hypothetical protein